MIRLFYGSEQTFIDVTETAFRRCFDGERIFIPADDSLRAEIFTDPLFGVVKTVILIRDENGSMSCTAFGAGSPATIVVAAEEKPRNHSAHRRIQTPPEGWPDEEKIAFIHRQLEFTGGSMADEGPEQRMVMRFLDPKARVLELGANIGRNTLMISSVLDDETNFVTLECDPISVEMLRNNRYANSFKFHIEPSALSYRKLMQRAWETTPAEELLPGYQWVRTITFAELVEKYGIEFDTLVADCEGALYYILNDNDELLTNVKTIIVESDYRSVGHKRNVEAIFRSHGLERVYSEALVTTWNHPFPAECAETFFEVWKK